MGILLLEIVLNRVVFPVSLVTICIIEFSDACDVNRNNIFVLNSAGQTYCHQHPVEIKNNLIRTCGAKIIVKISSHPNPDESN